MSGREQPARRDPLADAWRASRPAGCSPIRPRRVWGLGADATLGSGRRAAAALEGRAEISRSRSWSTGAAALPALGIERRAARARAGRRASGRAPHAGAAVPRALRAGRRARGRRARRALLARIPLAAALARALVRAERVGPITATSLNRQRRAPGAHPRRSGAARAAGDGPSRRCCFDGDGPRRRRRAGEHRGRPHRREARSCCAGARSAADVAGAAAAGISMRMTDVRPSARCATTRTRVDLDRVIVPPYDVIAPDEREVFWDRDPHNAIRLELTRDAADEAATDYARGRADARRVAGARACCCATRGRPSMRCASASAAPDGTSTCATASSRCCTSKTTNAASCGPTSARSRVRRRIA